uniref:Uncharacterized protein n=1 Tax=Pseudomonas phage Pavpe01 TaxID=3138545 RepID=A0AAU6W0D0_9VIRU
MVLPDGRYVYVGLRKSFAASGTTQYTQVVSDLMQASFFTNSEMNSEAVDCIRREHPTAFMLSARRVVTLELTGPINVGNKG